MFDDPLALSQIDPYLDEERWQTMGLVGPVISFVIYTWPELAPTTGQEVGRIISARKATAHERKAYEKGNSSLMTTAQKAELEALAILPDSRINTQDAPEQGDWSGARRSVFFHPIKKQLTLRLDADLIAWFRDHAPDGEGYQTSTNSALREYVARHEHK